MTAPNLFIVGAPKCGTTAIYHYLSTHPNIYLPSFKEPHYFADDLNTPDHVKSEKEYMDLFSGRKRCHIFAGEGSVWYLYSSNAIKRILEFNPKSKIIAMFRQPVDMFVSLHNQAVASLYEDRSDPKEAWLLQGERRMGRNISPYCEEPRVLQYADVCRLGFQLKRLLNYFPKEQSCFILFDDLLKDPKEVYRQILKHLNLPIDNRVEFPMVNEAHKARLRWLQKLHRRIDRHLLRAPKYLPINQVLSPLRPISRMASRFNTKRSHKKSLDSKFRQELTDFFGPDIEILQKLLGRDLSHWKNLDLCRSQS